MTRRWLATLLMIASIVSAGSVHAAGIEKLLMPGEVVAAHARTEEKCSACHDRANRERQNELCGECHKPVAADIVARKGFHGRSATGKACASCHSEHLGRGADIVRLNRLGFDHHRTDFRLTGAHVEAPCDACHKPGRKFREAPSGCVDCHRKVEPHAGKLGNQCGDCHSTGTWRTPRFDHGKTDYPLRGLHTDVACDACHIDNRYQDTPMQCVGCHAPDDVHRGGRGEKCDGCHTVEGWKKSRFDHERQTKFALAGAHARLRCQDCHRKADFRDKPAKDCHGCHAADDSHAQRFGRECGDCHESDRWEPVQYDHRARSEFALEGRHADLGCHACHTGSVKDHKPGKTCIACHRVDDPHATSLGEACGQCHNERGWRDQVRFDHDLTRFPLVGLHMTVPCENCHRSRDYAAAPLACNACHRGQDRHKGSLGERCNDCHNPNGWALWEFDHGKATHFALTGAHLKLECAACHREPPDKVKPAMECVACHEQDDAHAGHFGRQCARCHETTSFHRVRRH